MERELRTLIGRVRHRWLRLVALRTSGRLAAAVALALLAGLALDAAFRPQGWALIAGAAGVVACAAGAIFLLLLRAQRGPMTGSSRGMSRSRPRKPPATARWTMRS
jgi:hypothetical protein